MITQSKVSERQEGNQVSFIDFQLFQKIFGVKIVSIGLECPKCHKVWGFKVVNEKTIADVKSSKTICFHCVALDKSAW